MVGAVNILTGFLCSGKTTLLKHLLERGLDGKRVAVIVNEIGEIGIDGRTIECTNVEKMIELTSGCVCCSVSLQFGRALQSIMETVRPHLIIIETTGVADPIRLADEVLQAGFRLDAIITLVDAANILFQLRETSVAGRQVEAADFIVLNKTDLVPERERSKIEKRLRRRNGRALIVSATYGAVPHEILFGTSVAAHRERLRAIADARDRVADAPPSHHLADDGISAVAYELRRPVDRERFERFLRRLPRTVYRAKGVVRFDETSPFASLFNFTCGRYDFDWYRIPDGATPPSQGVFIGKDIEKIRDEILEGLSRCEQVAAG
ncbi:MAG: GTP-binding protein [Candidatus Rokubacteria bacterium]|nr:GTP-binding protein [Candidatus Rokubacteria bacterium]